jgi:hypothetical protein
VRAAAGGEAGAGAVLADAPLSCADLGEAQEVELARAELRSVRQAFQQGGAFEAPASLRRRLVDLLPTVLAR